MGGKGDIPETPNYQPIAQSSIEAAQLQAQTSREQLDWAKQQYAQMAPYTQRYMESMANATDAQTAAAAKDRARYEQVYQPIEDKFVQTANNWNSADRSEQQSGMAMADVATQFAAARQSATANLEGYGIDPSQTRYAALDIGTRVQQAAAQAAAGTQSRLNTEATALALQGEAINIGKGYPGQVSQSYAGATAAGASGINAGNQTFSTGGNMMGTSATWAGMSNSSNTTGMQAINTQFSNGMQRAQQQDQQAGAAMKGIGSMVGGALAVAALV